MTTDELFGVAGRGRASAGPGTAWGRPALWDCPRWRSP